MKYLLKVFVSLLSLLWGLAFLFLLKSAWPPRSDSFSFFVAIIIIITFCFLVPVLLFISKNNKLIENIFDGAAVGFIVSPAVIFMGFVNCWDGSKGFGGVGCMLIRPFTDFGVSFIANGHFEVTILMYTILGGVIGLLINKLSKNK